MDLEHFELKGNRAIFPYSVLTGCSDVAPKVNSTPECAGHGTMVTAIATGNANNGQGSAGIAPKCKFIPVSLGGGAIFNRNLLYTALTRAKKMVVLVGSKKNLKRMVSNSYTVQRFTMLCEFLKESMQKLKLLYD